MHKKPCLQLCVLEGYITQSHCPYTKPTVQNLRKIWSYRKRMNSVGATESLSVGSFIILEKGGRPASMRTCSLFWRVVVSGFQSFNWRKKCQMWGVRAYPALVCIFKAFGMVTCEGRKSLRHEGRQSLKPHASSLSRLPPRPTLICDGWVMNSVGTKIIYCCVLDSCDICYLVVA